MAATPLSPENERELAALRARAYGRDADTALDPQEVERLTELEDIAREARQETAPGVADDPAPQSPGIAEGSGRESPPPTLPWWRRVPLTAIVAGASVVGLATGFALPGLMPPYPHAVLGSVPPDGSRPHFGSYGALAGSPTRYDGFHDLEVWSLRTAAGAVCLVVRPADRRWLVDGCAPRPFDPIADLLAYRLIREIEGLDLPSESVVRFVLRDGAVHVWIDESEGEL